MKVSDVQIRIVKPHDGIIAFASAALDDSLYIGSIAVHEKLDGSGYRLTFPTKTVNGRSFQIFHPIARELTAALEAAIFCKLKEVMNKSNNHAGYRYPDA